MIHPNVVVCLDGVIYGIRPNGTLQWYRHIGYRAGQGLETNGAWIGPKDVGSGWAGFRQVFAGAEGHIYAVNASGEFYIRAVGAAPISVERMIRKRSAGTLDRPMDDRDGCYDKHDRTLCDMDSRHSQSIRIEQLRLLFDRRKIRLALVRTA